MWQVREGESMGVVVRRYIDFLILLILYLFFFAAASILFVHSKKIFSFFIIILQVWCSLKSVTTTLGFLFSWLHILHCTVVITLGNLVSFPSYM